MTVSELLHEYWYYVVAGILVLIGIGVGFGRGRDGWGCLNWILAIVLIGYLIWYYL